LYSSFSSSLYDSILTLYLALVIYQHHSSALLQRHLRLAKSKRYHVSIPSRKVRNLTPSLKKASLEPFRVAYITGAGSGIGRAITLQFAADGLRNIALVGRSKAGLVETPKLLTESHPDIKLFVTLADVSKEEDVKRCVEETVKKFGRIDHCVNAAGIGGVFVATGDLGAQQLDDVLGVNLRGVWLCEREEIRQLLKQEMRAVR
jgi:NADP-dependent 3-hydroxy acid dehydrogenase YdfG